MGCGRTRIRTWVGVSRRFYRPLARLPAAPLPSPPGPACRPLPAQTADRQPRRSPGVPTRTALYRAAGRREERKGSEIGSPCGASSTLCGRRAEEARSCSRCLGFDSSPTTRSCGVRAPVLEPDCTKQSTVVSWCASPARSTLPTHPCSGGRERWRRDQSCRGLGADRKTIQNVGWSSGMLLPCSSCVPLDLSVGEDQRPAAEPP